MERLEIRRLGHLGDGIAEGPVYVPGALPGEVVEGEVDSGVLAAPRIVTPSPDRVRPPCRHAKACGGCQVQHASDGFVTLWKEDIVRRALEAQGLVADFRPCFTSKPASRRRAGMSARRTKKGALAGFHQKASDIIVAVPDCKVLSPALTAALPVVEALALAGASRKSELTVLLTESLSGLDVQITGGTTPGPVELAALAQTYDLARIAWQDEVLTRRPPMQRFGKASVVPPPGAFLQATMDGEAALLAGVREVLQGAENVADLFAGCGTFALPLAEKAEIQAYEGARGMVEALDRGWREAPGLRRVRSVTRDLFRNPLLPDELNRLDGVVIDPPRAGAEAQVAQLARSDVARIAYVSCNPVSFARDCALLRDGGFRLEWVQVVDQFRWSSHVELVAGLRLGR